MTHNNSPKPSPSRARALALAIPTILALASCDRSGASGPAAAGPLTDADYWTLLTCPGAWDEMNLPLEKRIKLVDTSPAALTLEYSPVDNAEAIESRIAARGKEVRELLSPEEDAAFRAIFTREKMPHVAVTRQTAVIRFRVQYGQYKGMTPKGYWDDFRRQRAAKPSTWRDPKDWASWDPETPLAQISTMKEALQLAKSNDAFVVRIAHDWIKRAAVNDADRPAVLPYLRTLVFPLEPKGTSVEFLEYYFDWGTREQINDMLAVINIPFDAFKGNISQRTGWLALYLKAPDVFQREYTARRPDPDQRSILNDAFITWSNHPAPPISAIGKKMRAELDAWTKEPKNAQAIAEGKALKEKRELERTAPARAAAEAKMKADREAREKAATQAAAATALKSLSSPDPANWGKGFQALDRGAINDPADRQTLRAGLLAILKQTTNDRARRDALSRLNAYADPADIPALEAVVKADDKSAEHLRGPVMALILHLDPAKGLPIVESRAAYQVELNETVMTLASGWKAQAFPAAKVLFTSSKPPVRRAAVHALAESDKTAALPILTAAQKTEKDPTVLDSIRIYLSRLK